MVEIDLALDRDQCRDHVKTVKNLLVPQNAGKFLGGCMTIGLLRRVQLHGVSYFESVS
jgi:hypothetical protein